MLDENKTKGETMSKSSTPKSGWEIIEVEFKPDESLGESYGYLEISVNGNTYDFDEIPFDADEEEIDFEVIAEAFEEKMDAEDFASLSEDDFIQIAEVCARDKDSW